MKRVVPLVLTFSLLICCMIVPVSATENSVGYLDLMQYGGVIYDGVLYPNFQFVPNQDGWGYFEFPVSNRFSLGKAEFLIFSDASTLDISGVQGSAYFTESTSILPDARNRYRNYVGTFGGAWQTTDNIRVWFYYTGKSTNSAIKICSGKVMAYGYEPVEVMYDMQVYDADSGTKVFESLGTYRTEFWEESTYEVDLWQRQIRIYPNKSQLVGLDYIDLDLYMMNVEIDSISASFGGNALEVDYLTSFIGDSVYMDDAIGTDGIDKTFAVYKTVLRIDVSGVSMVEGSPCIFISYAQYTVNQFEPYIYVYGINGHVDWSDPDPKVTIIQRFKDAVGGWFEKLYSILGGDSTVADEFNQEVQDQVGELQQAQDVMNSVQRPDVDSVDLSVDGYVSQEDITVLTAPMTLFLTGDLYGPIVLMCIIMATVSYVLFGKR